jgi:DNA repair exonuclease SbcCD nuclease subunit
MHPTEALPLADVFDYVALGHGHKPYIIETPEGRQYAFNPGSPERVNFGEEGYDKGYWFVIVENGNQQTEFRRTAPRTMKTVSVSLDGAESVDQALNHLREHLAEKLNGVGERPLIEMKVTGRVRFHPFELGRERLRSLVEELADPLHVEIKNHLSLVTGRGLEETERRNLEEIERDVLHELIGANSAWKGKEDELVSLATAIRDQVLKGDTEGEELFALLK